MEQNYYDECLNKANECIGQNRLEEALRILQNELSMPYIPPDYQRRLQQAYEECLFKIKEAKRPVAMSIEEIEAALKADGASQLAAVNALNKMNLREHLDLVCDYLKHDHSLTAAALLMESLISQQITEEITVHSDENEIVFIPRYAELPYESDGFLKAQQFLTDWFSNDDPGFYKMCEQLLIQEAYLNLPIALEEDEALILALSIVRYVFSCMHNESGFVEFMEKNGFKCSTFFDLKCILL